MFIKALTLRVNNVYKENIHVYAFLTCLCWATSEFSKAKFSNN